MKRNAIIRIVLFSIAIFLLSGILLAGLGIGTYMFSGNHETHTSGMITHTPDMLDDTAYTTDSETIRDIEIDWAAGTITIIPTEQNGISVSEARDTDDSYPMVVKEAGSKLSIEYCEDATGFIGINRNYEAKHLVIYVPSDWTCDSLEIDAASAGLEVSDMVIREVEFDGASGVCSFTNCHVDQMSIDTASGDVNFTGNLNELDFDAMSACFHATLSNIPSRMDMDTMSGDLDITLPEDCGFTLKLDAMNSEFSSDFTTTMQNGYHICGDGACDITVSAMSGDVAIRKSAAANHHVHNESCYVEGSTCPEYNGTTHHEDKHH